MKVKGGLNVGEKIDVGLRVNQGYLTKELTGSESLTALSPFWHDFDLTGAQDVVLPDARTLTRAWQVVINNIDTTSAITVKNNAAAATVVSIPAGKAFKITCLSVATQDGTWYYELLNTTDVTPITKFADTFDATTDWTDDTTSYSITITEATHDMGLTPQVTIQELNGSNYEDVIPHELITVAASGNVKIVVTKTPDMRFAGRVIII